MDHHVLQAFQLADQHRIGSQLVTEFEQRHMTDDAGEVDRRLDTRVTATDHRHPLALEQWAVAVRAVGHTLVAVLLLARHVDFAPARAGGQNHGLAFQRRSIGELHADQATGFGRRDQLLGTLQVEDLDVVLLRVLLQRRSEFRPVGFEHRDEVLDAHRVHRLPAHALGKHAGADALARSVHGRSRACRAAADDQHVVSVLRAELGGIARGGTGVELLDDLFHIHPALAEMSAVQEHHRHCQDLALFHFGLVQPAVDHDALDARVQHRHQVQRLHNVRAVVAGQRHVGLEREVAF